MIYVAVKNLRLIYNNGSIVVWNPHNKKGHIYRLTLERRNLTLLQQSFRLSASMIIKLRRDGNKLSMG